VHCSGLPLFTSVEWPEAGVHYPAMDTLRSLEIGGYPLLLPSTIDLRKISSLRHLTLSGDLYAEGDEAQRQQVLKLQPHVTVSLKDYWYARGATWVGSVDFGLL
jgi:hypothetical protein